MFIVVDLIAAIWAGPMGIAFDVAQFYDGVDRPSRSSLAGSKPGDRMARSQPR